MLMQLLYLAGATSATLSNPQITNLVLSGTNGACSGTRLATSAKINASWTVANANNTLYETHVAVDGQAPTVQPSSVATAQYDTGLVVTGTSTIGYTFVVTVVRKADAVTVSSLTGTYSNFYGVCTGIGG